MAGISALSANPSGEEKNRALDHFIRGTIADEMEDYFRAVFHYQEALRYDSSSAFTYVALAQDYLLLGKASAAIDLLNKALRLNEDFIPALELKAFILRNTEKMVEARDITKRLVQLRPHDRPYQKQLLALELGLGNFAEADRLYENIAQEDSDTDLLTRQMLAVYVAAGETQRVIKLLEDIVKNDSTDASMLYALGTSYLQKGDSSAAETLVRRANALEPTVARFWIARAYLEIDRGRFEQANVVLDSALQIIGPQSQIYSLKGTVLNRFGATQDAIAALEKAIELDSTSFTAMGSLALIYDGLDSVEQAEQWYERAIVLSDSAAIYLNNLAYTYAVRGIHLEKAYKLAEKAVADEPENGAYLDTIGWIEYGLGHYRSAERWLKKALQKTFDQTITLEHLGDVYMKMGSERKAQKYYKQALERDPNNAELLQKAK